MVFSSTLTIVTDLQLNEYANRLLGGNNTRVLKQPIENSRDNVAKRDYLRSPIVKSQAHR